MNAWEVELSRPLSELPLATVLTIGVDGVDQLHPAVRNQLGERLRTLAATKGPTIRIVVADRLGEGSTAVEQAARWGATLVTTSELDEATIGSWLDERGILSGIGQAILDRHSDSWLLNRLLMELAEEGTVTSDLPDSLDEAYHLIHRRVGATTSENTLLAMEMILAANGTIALPFSIAHAALLASGQSINAPELRNMVTLMRPALIRLRPSTAHEVLLPLHSTYSEYLLRQFEKSQIREAHGWLLDALDTAITESSPADVIESDAGTSSLSGYALTTRPEHLLGVGHLRPLRDAISQLHDYRAVYAADRRDDWGQWITRVEHICDSACDPAVLELRKQFAHWAGQAGGAELARDRYGALQKDLTRILSSDHPDTFNMRARLVYWTGKVGRRAEARDACAALLDDQRRVLGPDHPDALSTRTHLADWSGEAGDPIGAQNICMALLGDQRRVLGPDHPDTFATRLTLARWTGVASNYKASNRKDARDQLAALLEDQLRVLGRDHPDTFVTRAKLAYWIGQTGAARGDSRQKAQRQLEALLADQRRVLGPDHPDTLSTRANIAFGTALSGNYVAALKAYRELLADHLRIFGPDHPSTMGVRTNVILWTGNSGDSTIARNMCRALLEDQQRVRGLDHPAVMATRGNLARWTGEAGDKAAAREMYRQLLDDQRRLWGADNLDTFTTAARLARWTSLAGDHDTANEFCLTILDDMARAFGRNDSRTAKMRTTLAPLMNKKSSGKDPAFSQAHPEKEVELTSATRDAISAESDNVPAARDQDYDRLAGLLEEQQRLLGRDHPETFQTRADLAHRIWERGDHTGAREMCRTLLADMGRVFGRDDSRTAKMRRKLAISTGDPIPGREQLDALLADQQSAFGPDHLDVFMTRAQIIQWIRQGGGDRSIAHDMCCSLLEDMGRVFGRTNVRTDLMRRRLAQWTHDASPGREQLEALLQDQLAELGTEHGDVFVTRACLARLTWNAGERSAAQAMCKVLLEDMGRAYGRDDPRTAKMRANLMRWKIPVPTYRLPASPKEADAPVRPSSKVHDAKRREKAGDSEGAEGLYREAADMGNANGMFGLARMRENAGDSEAAERWYRQSVEAGNTNALLGLARLREKAGDGEEAEQLAARAAAAGNPNVQIGLGKIRETAGDIEGAERVYWRSASIGDANAVFELARLRESAGDSEGAEQLVQQAAESGNAQPMIGLARMRENAGAGDDAERLYLRAAGFGNVSGLNGYAKRRNQNGDAPDWLKQLAQGNEAHDRSLLTARDERTRKRAGTKIDPVVSGGGDVAPGSRNVARETAEREGAKRKTIPPAKVVDPSSLVANAKRREAAEDSEAGESNAAELMYQQAADMGSAHGMFALARLREKAGDLEDAERWYWKSVEAGNTNAFLGIVRLRESTGDAEDAERLAARAAQTGNLSIQIALAKIREIAGDTESAERLYRKSAEAGDANAIVGLARLLEQAGDGAGAEELYLRAANRGISTALRGYANRQKRAGKRENAERLFALAAEAETAYAVTRLAAPGGKVDADEAGE